VLGGDENTKWEALTFLRRHRRELQKSIAEDIVMKYTPVLSFSIDKNVEQGDKVLAILEDLEKNDKK
jgi:ribosome-binding factor A